jgi:hypothetical protein
MSVNALAMALHMPATIGDGRHGPAAGALLRHQPGILVSMQATHDLAKARIERDVRPRAA